MIRLISAEALFSVLRRQVSRVTEYRTNSHHAAGCTEGKSIAAIPRRRFSGSWNTLQRTWTFTTASPEKGIAKPYLHADADGKVGQAEPQHHSRLDGAISRRRQWAVHSSEK